MPKHCSWSYPPLDVFEAAGTGDGERVRQLTGRRSLSRSRLVPDGFQALHLAAFFGHADAAEALLERDADPSSVSRHEFVKVTPLHSAVASEGAENVRTAEVLLAHGAPVNAGVEGGHTPLHSAGSNGNVAIVELLLAHGRRSERDERRREDAARSRPRARS